MELDQFITNTLTGLVNGIKNSNSLLSGSTKFELRSGEEIAFDIAVTATDKSATSKGGGIAVYSVKLGAEKDNSNSNEHVSRIKFKIKPNYNLK